jgi:CHAT domain-containing protein
MRALAETLLPDDVRAAVMSADAVILVPDGALHALPFEALETGDDPEPYWLDHGPVIRYAHSLSTLTGAIRRLHDRSGKIVTVCDPEFGAAPESGAPLPPLPGTRRESAAITGVFPPDRVVRLAGADATEAKLRRVAGDCLYLHLATHGLLPAAGDDRLAALAFTPGSGAADDDGLLHLFEIYSLNLHCEVAVLSACDTNAGRVVEGEGVFALSRGFHVAGARIVVASLWPLEDEAAAEILGTFLREVHRGDEALRQDRFGPPTDHARILRDAKRALRDTEQRSNPHYWAPLLASVIR